MADLTQEQLEEIRALMADGNQEKTPEPPKFKVRYGNRVLEGTEDDVNRELANIQQQEERERTALATRRQVEEEAKTAAVPEKKEPVEDKFNEEFAEIVNKKGLRAALRHFMDEEAKTQDSILFKTQQAVAGVYQAAAVNQFMTEVADEWPKDEPNIGNAIQHVMSTQGYNPYDKEGYMAAWRYLKDNQDRYKVRIGKQVEEEAPKPKPKAPPMVRSSAAAEPELQLTEETLANLSMEQIEKMMLAAVRAKQ